MTWRRPEIVAIAGWALLTLALGGCAATASSGDSSSRTSGPTTAGNSRATAPITNTDPCATRLHDLSGAMLMFDLVHGRAPESLEQLEAFDQGPTVPDAVCPVSGLPYVYRPGGIFLQDRGEYVILHDPAPSHSNMRWAVTLRPATSGNAPVTKVIALPESFFLLHPPE